jgi:hypothetical protein
MTSAATLTAVALAGAAPASAAPPSHAGDLYYVSGAYILARPVAGGAAHRVVRVGNNGPFQSDLQKILGLRHVLPG